MSELIETYTTAIQSAEIDKAQKEAERAKKLGEALVPQVVNMVQNGTQTDRARGFTHFIQKQMDSQPNSRINFDSTTMALNAELKKQGTNVEASVYEVGEGNDPAATTTIIGLEKIDGQEVRPKAS